MGEKRNLRLGVNVDHVATIGTREVPRIQTQSARHCWRQRQGRTALPRIFARTAVISSTTISSV